MRSKIGCVCAALLSACFGLSGAVFHVIDTTEPLKCVFSNVHQNRIAVDGGRVEKLIHTDESVAIRMEEESGQVFVFAVKPVFGSVVISIITDKGRVQDLEISFENGSPEVVILQEEMAKESAHAHDSIGIVIKKILDGQTPEGFSCVAGKGEVRNIGCGVFLETIARFEGCRDTVRLVRVSNTSCNRFRLWERNLSGYPTTQWVHMVENEVPPGGATIAILCFRRQ